MMKSCKPVYYVCIDTPDIPDDAEVIALWNIVCSIVEEISCLRPDNYWFANWILEDPEHKPGVAPVGNYKTLINEIKLRSEEPSWEEFFSLNFYNNAEPRVWPNWFLDMGYALPVDISIHFVEKYAIYIKTCDEDLALHLHRKMKATMFCEIAFVDELPNERLDTVKETNCDKGEFWLWWAYRIPVREVHNNDNNFKHEQSLATLIVKANSIEHAMAQAAICLSERKFKMVADIKNPSNGMY